MNQKMKDRKRTRERKRERESSSYSVSFLLSNSQPPVISDHKLTGDGFLMEKSSFIAHTHENKIKLTVFIHDALQKLAFAFVAEREEEKLSSKTSSDFFEPMNRKIRSLALLCFVRRASISCVFVSIFLNPSNPLFDNKLTDSLISMPLIIYAYFEKTMYCSYPKFSARS